jgi:hypothetical protein
MRARQEAFTRAAKHFSAILHLVPGQHVADWYGALAPSAYCELGYAPALVRFRDVEPAYEFGFFGTLSRRRASMLKRISKECRFLPKAAIRAVVDFPDQATRDRVMREAKVILQVRKHEEMGLVSSSRCNTALCLGRPVVAEPHALSSPWDKIVKFSAPGATEQATFDGFMREAFAARAFWREVHRQQFENFKRLLSPHACVGQALERVGVLERSHNLEVA